MLKGINKVVKTLVFSDLILLFGWGLIDPILAVFVIQNIKGGDASVAGIAVGIYWLIKSIAILPISRFLDKTDGERDDFYAMVFGILVASLVPLGLLFVSLPWHLYALQAVHALAMAFALPSWCGIFTRHIPKGKEAFSWSLDSSALGIGAGLAGIIGGVSVAIIGFKLLLIAVFILSFTSGLILIAIKKHLLPKKDSRIYNIPKYY